MSCGSQCNYVWMPVVGEASRRIVSCSRTLIVAASTPASDGSSAQFRMQILLSKEEGRVEKVQGT